jgi:hypothetical protein
MKGEPSVWGLNWATLFLDYKYRDLALQVGGSLESEKSKYGHEFHRILTRE